MAKPTTWSDVRKRVVRPEDERYIKQGREAIRAELRLAELRKHRRASQTDVARRLAVSQSNISQLERLATRSCRPSRTTSERWAASCRSSPCSPTSAYPSATT
jgi:DNA-binding XRE family transcriptional regulator